jgi:hypothetical protein
VNEFGETMRAVLKGRARLAFDDRHARIVKPDGATSPRRVMGLGLIVTASTS